MEASIVRSSFEFEGFTLDLARGCLRAGDRQIDLRPKSFDVLCHLLENAGTSRVQRRTCKDCLAERLCRR